MGVDKDYTSRGVFNRYLSKWQTTSRELVDEKYLKTYNVLA